MPTSGITGLHVLRKFWAECWRSRRRELDSSTDRRLSYSFKPEGNLLIETRGQEFLKKQEIYRHEGTEMLGALGCSGVCWVWRGGWTLDGMQAKFTGDTEGEVRKVVCCNLREPECQHHRHSGQMQDEQSDGRDIPMQLSGIIAILNHNHNNTFDCE